MNQIPLTKPDITPADIASVSKVLESGMLVQGEKVREVELALAEKLGISHAILVSNGTASLHLALLVLGVGPGDEVIVPAFSYVATANVVEMVGAKPVFVDITTSDFNISCSDIEARITDRTKAIMPVHEFGLCSDLTFIKGLADNYDIPVIEDAACALGATHCQQYAGSIGKFGSFSFHPRKSVTCGEGGCVVTHDDYLAESVRALRNHGVLQTARGPEFAKAGLNYRLTDIQGALLPRQLGELDRKIERRRKIAEYYQSELNGIDALLPTDTPENPHTWQTFHILLRSEQLRDKLKQHLFNHGVMSNYGAQCIPATPYYQEKHGLDARGCFPQAYAAFTRGLAIPLYDTMEATEVETVAHSVKSFNFG